MREVPAGLHPDVAEAFQQIDAGMFSGDQFDYSEEREYLIYSIGRWIEGMAQRPLVDEDEQTS